MLTPVLVAGVFLSDLTQPTCVIAPYLSCLVPSGFLMTAA